ncbi:MAG: pyrimidine/purine nucleoside phosphorylase [Nitrospiraceae bacterium]|nr:pyrimidine/purine nucleoside phosphorylase [Nitrospiraceae bacterium]
MLLHGETVWKALKGGQSFEVLAKSAFRLRVKTISDYCCSFVK